MFTHIIQQFFTEDFVERIEDGAFGVVAVRSAQMLAYHC